MKLSIFKHQSDDFETQFCPSTAGINGFTSTQLKIEHVLPLAWQVLDCEWQGIGSNQPVPAKQMIQATNFKINNSQVKRKRDTKFSVGLLMFGLALAAFFYWRHLHPSRPPVPSTAARKIPAAIKPEPAASSPKSDSPPAPAETVVAPKAATAGFLDFVIAVFSPSAQAETIQPAMQPAVRMVIETPKPAKRVVLQTAAANASPVRVPQELTAEQKRLKVAQDGFGDVMNLAYKNPDVYGFMTGEHLESARLGSPLPIYIIAQQGRERYAGQPVNSLLKPGNEWVYPIILENHVRFLVQVRYDGHDYVLGHGSRALAMAYEKILARWPAADGFHPKLATMPNLPSYYFTIPELPDQNITDVTRMLDFNPSLSPATVMLASWR